MGATVPAVSEGLGAYSTVKDGPFTVSSNSGTAEEITESLQTSESGDQGHDTPDGASESTSRDAKADEPTGEASTQRGPDGRFLPKEAQESKTDSSKESEAAKPLGKPRHDPRARVEEATREAAQAKRDAETARQEKQALEKRVRDLEARTAPPPPQTPPVQAQPQTQQAPTKPKAEDYKTWDDYQDARDEWVRGEAKREAAEVITQREQQYAQAQRQREATTTWEAQTKATRERLEAAEKRDPEFANKTRELAANFPVPHVMLPPGTRISGANLIATEILHSEQIDGLMLHFSEHPEDFQRIAALQTGRDIARAVAKLETRFEQANGAAQLATAPRAVSKAQPPARPVVGGSNSAEDEDEEDVSIEKLIKRSKMRRR